jgi:cyclic dehypoxanthinyl futalosine synthase
VGAAARRARERWTPADEVTFIVDRNVNYTNFCVTDCDFCAFYRHPRDPEGYVLPKSVIFTKIEETLDLGGTALLLQGGHHPGLRIEWYEDLFADIKRRYPIHLHALSPSEIQHIAHFSRLELDETLARLRAAGLDSVPGGGAEILVDRVRRVIAPKKTTTDEWLEVMRVAHRAGLSTTATMMYGTVDTWEDRVEHLRRLREVQDETGGFRAFICWSYQSGGGSARGEDHVPTTAADYLMMLAVSRLYLDNFAHFQSSWVTQGLRVGQLALEFGCDDMGSIMIEENVVRAAGTAFRLDTPRMVAAIEATGRRAVQRDTLYRVVRRF